MTAGPKLYCREPQIDPGGGGVNVARTVVRLGGSVRALVAVGGATGERLLELLAAEEVDVLPCRIAGETPYSLAVSDEGIGSQYRFCLPGEGMTPKEGQRVLEQIAGAVPMDGLVVLSGGMAAGLADDFPQQVQAVVERAGGRLVVDTSKAALMRLIDAPRAPLEVLRLDRSEMEKAFDRRMRSLADNLRFTEELVRRGVAKTVVTGHGAAGSVLVSGETKVFCHAPEVPVRSKVGAGDSLVGAFVYALSQGEAPEEALRLGVAMAAATVGTEGTTPSDLGGIEALLGACRLERF